MKKPNRRTLLGGILAVVVSGCSSTLSMAGDGADRSSAQMFPITEQQAEQVLATAMAAEFAGNAISRVEFPNRGFQTTIRFMTDSHAITAYMIQTNGLDPSGATVPGYYFEVSSHGTMPMTADRRSKKVFERAVADASLIAAPLPMGR